MYAVVKDFNYWALILNFHFLFRLYFHLPSNWQGTIFDLFWVTLVTDSILRFGTTILKSLIVAIPQICLPQKKRVRVNFCPPEYIYIANPLLFSN